MKIISIKYVKDYKLLIELSNGKSKQIDLENFVKKSKHSLIHKYANKSLFKQVYLDERGAPCWGDNEMDINPQSIINGDFDLQATHS